MTMEANEGTRREATSAIEQTLEELLQSLIEMGICASDVQESALETAGGVGFDYPGGLMGRKAAQTVEHLATLQSMKDSVSDVLIPIQVINLVDGGKNPHTYTRDIVERVAGENTASHGVLTAITDYTKLLNEEMILAFPEMAEMLPPAVKQEPVTNGDTRNGDTSNGDAATGRIDLTLDDSDEVKMEE